VVVRAHLRTYGQLARAGFRRQSTYRLGMLAGVVSNIVFGFIRGAILIAAVESAGGTMAGYTRDTISTYVWLSQAMMGAVDIGGSGSTELSDRIRNADVAVDFTRPVDLQGSYLAADLGRAAFTFLPHGLPTVLVGALTVGLTLPSQIWPYLLGMVSVTLAVSISFLCGYAVNILGFWLVETRGLRSLYMVTSSFLARAVRARGTVPRLAVHPRPGDALPFDPAGPHRHHLGSCRRNGGRQSGCGAMPLGCADLSRRSGTDSGRASQEQVCSSS
jgi:ABC-2 type transport system permease protein